MKFGNLMPLRNRNGLNKANGSLSGSKLSKSQRKQVRKLQHAWLSMAIDIISSTRSIDSVTIGITSADREEGKTTTCLGLAAALAREADALVVVVECDTLNPSLAARLDIEPNPNLIDYVSQTGSIEDILHRTGVDRLDVIVAGPEESDGADLEDWSSPSLSLLTRRLPHILPILQQMYSYVLLDLPPVLTNPYTKEIVNHLYTSFLVVKSGVSNLEGVERAIHSLGEDKFSGLVLSGAASPMPSWFATLLEDSE